MGHGLDSDQSVFVRQHAYCLIFGIKPEELKTVERENYYKLLDTSKKRVVRHDEFPKGCLCQVNSRKRPYKYCEVIS